MSFFLAVKLFLYLRLIKIFFVNRFAMYSFVPNRSLEMGEIISVKYVDCAGRFATPSYLYYKRGTCYDFSFFDAKANANY